MRDEGVGGLGREGRGEIEAGVLRCVERVVMISIDDDTALVCLCRGSSLSKELRWGVVMAISEATYVWRFPKLEAK